MSDVNCFYAPDGSVHCIWNPRSYRFIGICWSALGECARVNDRTNVECIYMYSCISRATYFIGDMNVGILAYAHGAFHDIGLQGCLIEFGSMNSVCLNCVLCEDEKC